MTSNSSSCTVMVSNNHTRTILSRKSQKVGLRKGVSWTIHHITHPETQTSALCFQYFLAIKKVFGRPFQYKMQKVGGNQKNICP